VIRALHEVKLFASVGLARYWRAFLGYLASPRGNNIPSPRSEAFSTIWLSMLSFPEKRLGLPNRETATAQTFTNHPHQTINHQEKAESPLAELFACYHPTFSEAEKQRRGGKQYSRIWGLSRGYPYIL
jgi:hypothetical protein